MTIGGQTASVWSCFVPLLFPPFRTAPRHGRSDPPSRPTGFWGAPRLGPRRPADGSRRSGWARRLIWAQAVVHGAGRPLPFLAAQFRRRPTTYPDPGRKKPGLGTEQPSGRQAGACRSPELDLVERDPHPAFWRLFAALSFTGLGSSWLAAPARLCSSIWARQSSMRPVCSASAASSRSPASIFNGPLSDYYRARMGRAILRPMASDGPRGRCGRIA